ncbi:MAG TPA: GLPGLI family protein [Chitinophagaceae bacterium]|nr:GLPGLI family protein [Chitinophagaceae bacterium]
MKKILVLLMASIAFKWAAAQVKEGKIIYEEKVDAHRRIPKENEELRARMPQFRTNMFELLFADNKSLYRAKEEEPDLSEQPQGGIVLRFGSIYNIFYKDFTTLLSIEKRELLDKEFIVEDSLRNISWKLADGETKTILNHTCKKATGKTERGNNVVAWYTEDIVISSGPAQFGGLPGLILGLDVNEGEFVYTALEIGNVKKADIKVPTKGKKVTPAEFAKTRKELLGDNNNGVKIVTN